MGQEAIITGPGDDDLDDDDLLDELDDQHLAEADAGEPDEPAGPSVEELLEQNERLQAAVKRNNGELAKSRLVRKAMAKYGIDDLDTWLAQQGIDLATGARTAAPVPAAPAAEGAGQPEPAAAETVEPAATPAAADHPALKDLERKLEVGNIRAETLETRLRDMEVAAALKAANYTGTTERAMRLLNLENMAVDEDGAVTGVEAEVKALQGEFPELFREPRKAPPPPPPPRGGDRYDGGDKRPAPPRRRGWVDQISDTITSGR